LKEGQRIRVYENRLLRKLHNEFYNRTIKSRRIIWAGQVARVEKEDFIQSFRSKARRKRPLGRLRRRWVDNIKMNLRENGVVLTALICLRIWAGEGHF
jgi:hypothetical protein